MGQYDQTEGNQYAVRARLVFTGGQYFDGATANQFILNSNDGSSAMKMGTDGENLTVGAGTGGTLKEYINFSRSAAQLLLYRDGAAHLQCDGGIGFHLNLRSVVDITADVGSTTGRFKDGLFGGQLGFHTGTRFTSWHDSNGLGLQPPGGGQTLQIGYLGAISQYATVVASSYAHRRIQLNNRSGGATVAGYVYVVSDGAVDDSVGAAVVAGTDYLAASNQVLVVCVGGGVADGSNDWFVPMRDGDIVNIYASGPCTKKEFVNITAAGTAGTVDPAANMAAGETVGICLKTTGGAGLVRIMIIHVWA